MGDLKQNPSARAARWLSAPWNLLALWASLCQLEEGKMRALPCRGGMAREGWCLPTSAARLVRCSAARVSLFSCKKKVVLLPTRTRLSLQRGLCGVDKDCQGGASRYRCGILEAEALREMPLILRRVMCFYVLAVPVVRNSIFLSCAGN